MTAFGEALEVALLTGGGDKPYAIGMATSLIEKGVSVDFIGSDDLLVPELLKEPRLRFLNLRGSQNPKAPWFKKLIRVIVYYAKLLHYATAARPRIFHILWNNKFELLDRTLLLLYYRLMRRRVVLTVHNVNIKARDGNDGLLNRLTLRIQYALADHLFVHTQRMRMDLEVDFRVPPRKISVIPFGINSTIPISAMSSVDARGQLGLAPSDRVVLFYGNIARYKGLEYLIEAMAAVVGTMPACRLVIAGRPKGDDAYWPSLQRRIDELGLHQHVLCRIEYVPDSETERYFKAADVLALPYTFVFQSGVMFLAYNFGLPVIASDVGSLREEVIDGVTGYICMPRDPADISRKIVQYFESELFRDLQTRRLDIRQFASERYSWSTVSDATCEIYARLLKQTTAKR